MHGCGGEQRKQRQHMLPVHSNSKIVAADLSASEFFLKDGRKIHVGDCALFKPPLDSPPFIGIIRRLKADKENSYCLDVNWLYRPAEIKLAKGILSDAAPNEVFYSFHKDEIPAASLVHPCKVAFLRKGVKLPSGISSFVCRRVYDTDYKCLWWLTDKDYINERQEEVDQLLDRTRLEMHGAMQSEGCSPKPLNVPTSVLQSNPCSDSVENSSSFTSQVKHRKMERVDQGSDPTKREHFCKAEDGESGHENTLKYEISKITDKRGLRDIEGVEKLIKLMQLDSVNKKIDLAGRILLVDVVAATDRLDCLGLFLQLRGLPVLDEWLQEVHKGKICGSGLKESDTSIDEFIFSLLRALEKLPVNLLALQTCNVGKSVNHLRTHKNSEIQRKARSLVDTWKKRVEAEMNENDAKSGLTHGSPWPNKPVLSEVPNIGSRKSGVSAEGGGAKSSSMRPTTPKNSQKFAATEIIAQSSISSGAMKSITSMVITSKDQNLRPSTGAGAPDFPMTPTKDEKSSSSNQSQSNSQSSDYAKTVVSSRKENRKNLTSGLRSKVSSGASPNQKSNNGHLIATASAVQKESISGKDLAFSRNLIPENFSRASHDKLSDSPPLHHGNSRLIVRLPNTSRSPTKSAPEDSPEHLVISCCKSSPSTERPGSCDIKLMGKTNIIQSNTAPDGNSDFSHEKEDLYECEQGSELSPDDKQHRVGEDDGMHFDLSISASLSTEIISRSGKSYEASLSSMNALIESCAKLSECIVSPGDEVGMNLLATVAAEQISKSSNASLLDSPGRNSPLTDNLTSLNTRRLDQFCEEVVHAKFDSRGTDCTPSEAVTGDETDNISGNNASHMLTNSFEDEQCHSVSCFRKLNDCSGHLNSSSLLLHPSTDGYDSKLDGLTDVAMPSLNTGKEGNPEVMRIINRSDQTDQEISITSKVKCSIISAFKLKESLHLHEHKKVDQVDTRTEENSTIVDSEVKCQENKVDENAPSSDVGINNQMNKELTNSIVSDKAALLASEISSDVTEGKIENDVNVNGSGNNLLDKESQHDMVDNAKLSCNAVHIGGQMVNLGYTILEVGVDSVHENIRRNKTHSGSSQAISHESPSPVECIEQTHNLSVYNTDDSNFKKDKDSQEFARFSGSHLAVKRNFDLNEGFSVDDSSQVEPVTDADAGNSFAAKFSCPLPFSISTKPGAFPASITIASAAKGPVVPPENLLRTNGELGWKGSAATSAFRPAEPRKFFEMPFSMSDGPVVTTVSKQGSRPHLDFDLNEPDDRLLEEIGSESATQATCYESGPLYPVAGGLDLDLNRVEEISDLGLLSMGSGRLQVSTLQNRSSLHAKHGGVNVSRDFDLNNGPCMEEVGTELTSHYQKHKNIVPLPSTMPSLAMNSVEFGTISSWFPPGNFSAITAIPSIFPGRGDQSYVTTAGSQRLLVPPTATTPFAAEMYRGPVLSSSPAMAFPPSTPYHYPAFSFDTSFSMSSSPFSGCSTGYMDSTAGGSLYYPTIHSQLGGPTGLVSTPYPRPYIMSFPGGGSNVGPDNGKWGNLGLDLNTGPGGTDVERRDERFASSLRHFPAPNSQSLVDEPLKLFKVGGVLKRKEPDSGLDVANRFRSNQPSRQ